MQDGLGGGSWLDRSRSLLASSIALLLLLALVAGSAAAAQSDWKEQKRSLTLMFEAPASNDFVLSIVTAGHRHVWATLERGRVSVTYRTEGKVSREGVKADFGALGSIDVKLRDRRPLRPNRFGLPPGVISPKALPRRECRGRKPQRFAGRMVGSIELEGENGFARVETDSAKGRVYRSYRRFCKPPERRSAEDPGERGSTRDDYIPFRFAIVSASGEAEGRSTFFEAFTLEPDPKFNRLKRYFGAIVSAGVVEEREGMLIRRSAFGSAKPEMVWISRRGKLPTRAKLVPPKPFSGTASLTQPKGGPVAWKGDLAVRLPGIPPVPLTGPGMKARVCRISDFGGLLRDCLTGRQLLQLSGSHSQALADVRLSISR